MITKIYIDNYKSFVNFSLDFKDINILIGRNGTGKTSILKVINALSEFVSSHKKTDAVFSENSITKWVNHRVQTYELYIQAAGHDYCYHLEVEYDDEKKGSRVKKENVKCDDKNIFNGECGKVTLYNDAFSAGPEIVLDWNYSGVGMVADRHDNKLLTRFKTEMTKVIICAPKPYLIDNAVDIETRLPDYNFKNLGGVLKWLLLESPEKITKLNEEYRTIFPSFTRVYLSGAGDDKTLLFEYRIDKKDYSFKASDISDGERQLYILYVLAVYYLKEGYTLFIDEPDNYIAINEIQPWCIRLQEIIEDEGSTGQCVIASHHPEIIDYFAHSSGLWLKRKSNYLTQLEEAPQINPDNPIRFSEYLREIDYE